MPGDERKLRELIIYIAHRTADDATVGATKLNKLLYFADFAHFRTHGRPITGVDYMHQPQGPVPRRLRPVRQQLIDRGDARLVVHSDRGREQHRLVAERPADPDAFTPEELETIDRVISELWGRSARYVSDLSHEEAGWRFTTDGEDIPYQSAWIRPPSPPSEAVRRRAREVAERLASQRVESGR